METHLSLYLQVSSADNFCKQFGSMRFDTLMVFLKEFSEKINFEKKLADDNKAWKIN